MSGVSTERLERLVALHDEKSRIEAEAKRVAEEIAALDAALCEEFAEAGQRSVKTAGGVTCYLNSRVFADCRGDKPAVVAALAGTEWAHVVKPDVNGNTLNALVAEFVANGGIPAALAGVLGSHEKFTIGIRRS